MNQIYVKLILIILMCTLISCQNLPAGFPMPNQPLSDEERQRLEGGLEKMCEGDSTEEYIDCRIKMAVDQMLDTLNPKYKNAPLLGKYRIGFVEVSDIDRTTVNKLHKYITEKIKLVLFYQPVIRDNFEIKDVQLENLPYATNDQQLAKEIGQSYGVDIILTGLVTISDNFVDMNLRMTESTTGQIVAVGSVKIDNNATVNQWLQQRV